MEQKEVVDKEGTRRIHAAISALALAEAKP
jgi:hypothetical protein